MKRNIICTIYDKDLKVVGNITSWKSIIRTVMQRGTGEFELKAPASPETISALWQGYFIHFQDDKSAYLIEYVRPDILQNNMNTVVVKGRCLKSLLDLRVVWGLQIVSGTRWNRMYWLMHNQAIAPSDSNRIIPYLQDLVLDGDDKGETETNAQYTGDNLLDACVKTLGTGAYGWKMSLDLENKQITNTFYVGVDRTSTVKFHNLLGNLKNISYIRNVEGSANTAIIGGEGEGSARKYRYVNNDNSGLVRRELFVDARDLQSSEYSSTTKYNAALDSRGSEKLSEKVPVSEFTFDAVSNVYKFKEHYNVGDMVRATSTDVLGIDAVVRVIGVQISDDSDGHNETPIVEIVSTEVIA